MTPEHDRHRTALWALVAFLGALAVWPLWAVAHLPLPDWPAHLRQATILHDWQALPLYREAFTRAPGPTPLSAFPWLAHERSVRVLSDPPGTTIHCACDDPADDEAAAAEGHVLVRAALVLGLVLSVGGCGACDAYDPVERPAPDLKFRTLDGAEVSLSSLRGHPLVLHAWLPG